MSVRVFIVILILVSLSACSNRILPVIDNSESINPTTATAPVVETTRNFESIVAVQSNNGVTVAITWIYVDTYRLAFETRVSGVSVPTGYSLPCPIKAVTITDEQGYSYPDYENGQGDSENLSAYCVMTADSSYIATYNFYHQRTDIQEQNISMTVSLGNFELYSDDGQKILLPDFGKYIFDLSLPIQNDFTINLNEVVEISRVEATLRRVEINPTITTANLCIQYEDHHGWYPELSVVANDENILAISELTRWTNYDPNTDWYDSFTSFRCYKFTFPVNLIANSVLQAKKIDISLNNLEINFMDAVTQDECAAIQHEIQTRNPGLNFICHIDYRGNGYGFSFEITNVPFGITVEHAQEIVEDGFRETITGPWTFSIELPSK